MTVGIFISRVRILITLGVMLLTSVYCRDASSQVTKPSSPPPVPRRDTSNGMMCN